MNGKYIKGFVDPITLGFVIAIAGAALGMHFGAKEAPQNAGRSGDIAQVEQSTAPTAFWNE